MKHLLTIKGTDKMIEVDPDQNLLSVLRDEKIYVKSSCGGYASCGDCLIKVTSGADNMNAPSFEEKQLLGNVFHITKERLSCQSKITGPVEIDISKHDKASDDKKTRQKSGSFKARVRKPDDVKAVLQERLEKREERDKNQESWQKHWQKEQDPMNPKRLGGGKRPKPFRTDHLDDLDYDNRDEDFFKDLEAKSNKKPSKKSKD